MNPRNELNYLFLNRNAKANKMEWNKFYDDYNQSVQML